MTGDIINGLFEFIGGIVIWTNVARLVRDQGYAGVNWVTSVFFFTWGVWNLWYYPSLDQMWSFVGGLAICSANLVWVILALHYGPFKGRRV